MFEQDLTQLGYDFCPLCGAAVVYKSGLPPALCPACDKEAQKRIDIQTAEVRDGYSELLKEMRLKNGA